jgi:hypothetical protein
VVDAMISHANSPSQFWIQINHETYNQLSELEAQLNAHYSQKPEKKGFKYAIIALLEFLF